MNCTTMHGSTNINSYVRASSRQKAPASCLGCRTRRRLLHRKTSRDHSKNPACTVAQWSRGKMCGTGLPYKCHSSTHTLSTLTVVRSTLRPLYLPHSLSTGDAFCIPSTLMRRPFGLITLYRAATYTFCPTKRLY